MSRNFLKHWDDPPYPENRRTLRLKPRVVHDLVPDPPRGEGEQLLQSGLNAEPCRVGSRVKTGDDGSGKWLWGFPCRNKGCPWCFANTWYPEHLFKATERLGPEARCAYFEDLPPRYESHDQAECDIEHKEPDVAARCIDRAWWASLFEGPPTAYVYPLADGRDIVVGNLKKGLGTPVPTVAAIDNAVRRMAVGQDVKTGLLFRVASRGFRTRIAPPEPGEEPRKEPEPGEACVVGPEVKNPQAAAAELREKGIDVEVRERRVSDTEATGRLEWGPTTPAQWTTVVKVLHLRTIRHVRWENRERRYQYFEVIGLIQARDPSP